MSDICAGLNGPQKEAVISTEGPVLVLAGAGSGKTRALTHRIAYLIEEKEVDPWNILAITFTNKAAQEMKERVCALTESGSEVWVSTFHSSCVRFLRAYGDRLGYNRDFTIYDSDDSKVLIRRIIKDMDYDPKIYKEKEVQREISSLKNKGIHAEDYAQTATGHYRDSRIAAVFTEYQKRLMKANAMDFDDLLLNAVQLFQENEDVLERYQRRFRYILVDEYQDTNSVQFELVALLAAKEKNICVVGDDDQSIYRFRGADISNILNFEKVFPGAKVIRLEQNYRSTKNILAAANAVIANNEGRKSKTLWSDKAEGDKVALRVYNDGQEEAAAIAGDIFRQQDRFSYQSCAILYRTNSQSRLLEEALVKRNIPYNLIGGTGFYDRREIKDILAYLKLIANEADDVSARRILNVPKRGLGTTTEEKIAALAMREGLSFYAALKPAAKQEDLKRASKKLEEFSGLIEDLKEAAGRLRVYDLLVLLTEKTDFQKALAAEAEDDIEATARWENVLELENKAAEFNDEAGETGNLERFLEEVALVSDVDSYEDKTNRVTLMTIHSAKGLEFDKVYLAGMEQGLFPGNRALDSGNPEDIEEERRLCYVGFTRAKEKLILTAARIRMVNGRTDFRPLSQFVGEIRPEDLKNEGTGGEQRSGEEGYRQENRYGRRPQPGGWIDFGDSFGFGQEASVTGRNLPGGAELFRFFEQKAEEEAAQKEKAAEQQAGELKAGDRVRHARHGDGTVLEVRLRGESWETRVAFDRGGEKLMQLKSAGLTKL